jgi:hypothetical protein
MYRLCNSAPAILVLAAFLLAIFPALDRAQSAPPVLTAKIDGNLNTKSAKIGDLISAKTVKAAKLKDGSELPKGSKLFGTVVAVQSKRDGNGNSALDIKFDKVEVKRGTVIPVKALIVAIGPAPDSLEGKGLLSGLLAAGGGPPVASNKQTVMGMGYPADHDAPDMQRGSTLKGVSISVRLDAQGADHLRGVGREIKLDSDVQIMVELE